MRSDAGGDVSSNIYHNRPAHVAGSNVTHSDTARRTREARPGVRAKAQDYAEPIVEVRRV